MNIYDTTIIDAIMPKFAFTIVDNRKADAARELNYLLVFQDWLKAGLVINCKFMEYNKHGYSHYHGIVSMPKNVYRKKLIPAGYSVRFKKIFDEEKWLEYCEKDQDPDEDTNDNELMIRLKRPIFINKFVNHH